MTNNTTSLLIFACMAAFVIGCLLVYGAFPRTVEKTVEVKVPELKVVEVSVPSPVDVTGIQASLDSIKQTVTKDDTWEDAAIVLADAEWAKSKNKNVFKAIDSLVGNIDEREDISSVTVEEVDTKKLDVDKQDATVIEELKVKYEDVNGSNKKVYLIVTTVIKDNEVDSYKIVLK